MPLLFQIWELPASPRPETGARKDATLSRQDQFKVAKEGFEAACNSMRLLGYKVDALLSSGKLDDFKKAKPAKKISPENEQAAKEEYGKAIRAFQYLFRYYSALKPKPLVREGGERQPLTPEEGRKINLNYLTSGLDAKPDWSYLYNAMELCNSYVLESTPKKK